MEYIYSKIDPSLLLHIIVRNEDILPGRIDVVPEHEFLQMAALNMEEGKTFKPHKHPMQAKEHYKRAQESWIVLSGKVKAILYDINDEVIATPILNAGDLSITLMAGHTYELLEDSKIIEVKTGPYYGQEIDKTFI